jgi:hypothetical protein
VEELAHVSLIAPPLPPFSPAGAQALFWGISAEGFSRWGPDATFRYEPAVAAATPAPAAQLVMAGGVALRRLSETGADLVAAGVEALHRSRSASHGHGSGEGGHPPAADGPGRGLEGDGADAGAAALLAAADRGAGEPPATVLALGDVKVAVSHWQNDGAVA